MRSSSSSSISSSSSSFLLLLLLLLICKPAPAQAGIISWFRESMEISQCATLMRDHNANLLFDATENATKLIAEAKAIADNYTATALEYATKATAVLEEAQQQAKMKLTDTDLEIERLVNETHKKCEQLRATALEEAEKAKTSITNEATLEANSIISQAKSEAERRAAIIVADAEAQGRKIEQEARTLAEQRRMELVELQAKLELEKEKAARDLIMAQQTLDMQKKMLENVKDLTAATSIALPPNPLGSNKEVWVSGLKSDSEKYALRVFVCLLAVVLAVSMTWNIRQYMSTDPSVSGPKPRSRK